MSPAHTGGITSGGGGCCAKTAVCESQAHRRHSSSEEEVLAEPGGSVVAGQGVLARRHNGHGGLVFHPADGAPLGSFFASSLKRTDMHVAAVVEGHVWSPLLSAVDRRHLLQGAIAEDCLIELACGDAAGESPGAGASGYEAWVASWKAAMPDCRSSTAPLLCGDVKVSASVAVAWTRSGTFSGPANLFGVKPTGGHLTICGVSLVDMKGAQVTRLRVFVALSPATMHAAIRDSVVAAETAAAAASSEEAAAREAAAGGDFAPARAAGA